MTQETQSLRQEAQEVKIKFYNGLISYDEAKKLVKPYIDAVNSKSRELAKKYNQKPRLVSVTGYLR